MLTVLLVNIIPVFKIIYFGHGEFNAKKAYCMFIGFFSCNILFLFICENYLPRRKCAASAEVEKETNKLFKMKMKSETLQKNNLLGEFVSGNKQISLYIDGPYGYKTGFI